jgi:hypothetical protein
MTTNPLTKLSIRDLKNAIALRERIDTLREEFDRLVNGTPSSRVGYRTRAKRLTAGNARVNLERQGRQRGVKRRQLSRAARARLSAMAKARWAKTKARGRNRL